MEVAIDLRLIRLAGVLAVAALLLRNDKPSPGPPERAWLGSTSA